MPLVFVHGVSNRDTPDYRDNELVRDAFLRTLVLPSLGLQSAEVRIFNPYWGEEGVKFRWGNASVPESVSAIETFGAAINPVDLRIGAEVLVTSSADAADIIGVAKRSLLEAIELVWSATLPDTSTTEEAEALAEGYRRAVYYAAANSKPGRLSNATSDNFVDLLLYHVKDFNRAGAPANEPAQESESFGGMEVLDSLKEGVSRITSVGRFALSSVVTTLCRKRVHWGASMFVGDVLQYLNTRGERANPGPIVMKVLTDFRRAREFVTARDPKLIIVGHSLGGVISYDILTHFDSSINVDAFVTVGSQVALFEEMSLYKESRPSLPANPPADRLTRPLNIKRWLNVLDGNDVFSFRAEGVFNGVTDFKFETGYGLMEAHSGYFRRPSFYRRLGERLAQP